MSEDAREPVVVVGVDGSESSKHALRWAARQAELSRARLVAITAWHLPEIYGYVPRDHAHDAETMLRGVVEEVLGASPPVPLEPRVVEGRPAAVLIEASRNADLIVLGTRGHGGFEGMLLGSVSQHCVHHAVCPVVVVPSGTS
ncbi:universal stress protein [Nocardioides taihuensis]|uniref:Universal stress protein n=1 Tax=Nocardioides taihuensis TaxID=1835606 RepID=A0ABW0BLZ4_9ACTN